MAETYDPIPDFARLLRAMEWDFPIGTVLPNSIYAIWNDLAKGMGVVGTQPALEWEKILYRQLANLAEQPDGWHQKFVMREGVIACASCEVTMTDGEIAHTAECPALLRGVATR